MGLTLTQARRMMFRPTAAVLCILALAGAQAQEQAAAPVAEAAPAAVEAAPATPAVEVATEAPAPVVEAVAKSAESKEVIPVSSAVEPTIAVAQNAYETHTLVFEVDLVWTTEENRYFADAVSAYLGGANGTITVSNTFDQGYNRKEYTMIISLTEAQVGTTIHAFDTIAEIQAIVDTAITSTVTHDTPHTGPTGTQEGTTVTALMKNYGTKAEFTIGGGIVNYKTIGQPIWGNDRAQRKVDEYLAASQGESRQSLTCFAFTGEWSSYNGVSTAIVDGSQCSVIVA